jgi:iron complex outermembrane receptor protein
LERVEVTGSNIKRVDAETSSPVLVVTRADIESSGKVTLAEIIQALPINNNGSVPTSFGNGFAAGASGASLRGLSVNSTLVLVNGRRLAPYGLADDGQRNFSDLSSIPLDLVDRVEVLKDGASAVYGSDAIAGVINIVLRKEFKGVLANASVGSSRYGDANSSRAAITAGFGDLSADNYNVIVNLEASKQNSLSMNDRNGKREFIGVPDASPWGFDAFTGLGMVRGWRGSLGTSSSPTGWARPVDGPESVTPLGGYAQLSPTCVPPISGQTLPMPAGHVGCLWNVYDYIDLQPQEEKTNIFTRGTLNINATTQAYGEFGLFNSKVTTRYTPSAVSSVWPNAATNAVMDNTFITMGPNHPDNPFPGDYARLRYVTADLGGRDASYDTTVSRILVGVKGTLDAWDYDAGFLYTESKTDIVHKGYVRNSVLRDYLNGTNASGANPTGAYYRLGVNAGLNSAAVNAAISPALNNSTKTSVTALDAKGSRELMALAGGAMSLAVGGELRSEKLDSPATPYTEIGDIIGLGYSAFKQTRNVSAVFAEINAPVTKALELTAALRDDHYSDWGNAVTPKVGAKWQVAAPLLLRGTFAKGFRAPGAAEGGDSSSAGYTSYVDPVRCPGGEVAAGAVASKDCGNGQTVTFSTGNKQIQPEKSDSFNLGLVFEPTKQWNMALDFWQITRKNEIIGADVQAILNNPGGYPTAQIIRDATDGLVGVANSGTLLAVLAPYQNGPKTKTNGIDLDLNYKGMRMDNGVRLSAGMNVSYTKTFERTMPDGTVLNYAGTFGPTSLSSSAGMPKTRAVFSLTGERGPWSVTGRVNYTGAIRVIESLEDPTCLAADSNGNDVCEVGAITTMDLFGKYSVNKDLEITGSILNLFDRIGSFDPQSVYGQTRYSPSYNPYGGIGRYFNVGLKYKFK